ncbi:hypothetical protein [Corallococcus terminator]|uniref:Uncharacterized protein n=1 Tax=Corallococcus terminator TaxID=2316733 RepID=A0A3A8IQE7_9BACT|nr:hypothetical protein [Corallococcus terminator]RKG82000.1 hypothetical protein D7V88_25760 [Corallococcus terminator]
MRGEPSRTVTCYVCGSKFTVHQKLVVTRRETVVRPDPEACPFCDTPLKTIPPLDEGIAKGLVLTAAEFPEEKKEYGTAEDYLEEFTLTEQDVDALVELAQGLDSAEWARDNAERLQRRKNPSVQAVSRFLPKLQAQVESGVLPERLRQAAEHVKEEYRARRKRHLAIFERRKQQS